MRRLAAWCRASWRWGLGWAIAAVLLVASPVGASDLAEEADLLFRMGNERARAGEYREALLHYLHSNRLVHNRNVIFNIASMHEALGQHADAYRYYVESLDTDMDPASRAGVLEAIGRMRQRIGVVRVVTDPPGATIFVDRKDLGSRGQSPQMLAFVPGRHRIMVELTGYRPVEPKEVDASAGSDTAITFRLEQLMGKVRVQDVPSGTRVRIDKEDAKPIAVPAEIELPAGDHDFQVTSPGREPVVVSVHVAADATVRISPRLALRKGSVVVTANEPSAAIDVDNVRVGFTPAVIPVSAGQHEVTVSRAGFRPEQHRVDIAPEGQERVDVALTPVERVITASRVEENVEEAPSSVSVIPSREITAMAYPTVVEALRGARGVFVGDDRSYAYVGVRGFARPGDYGNRVLVLLDGHPLNDNYVGSSYVGFDARSDLGDLERIEIVRGAGSVLYGTGALSGVINLVTRYRDEPTGVSAAVGAAEYGVMRGRVRGTVRMGKDTGVWLSVAGVDGQGRDFYQPEFASEPNPSAPALPGLARGMDGFRAGTLGGRFWSGPFAVQWFYHSRSKTVPTAPYGALFGDSRSQLVDTRGALESRFEPRIARTVESLTRAYANVYKFRGTYPYDPSNGGLMTEEFQGLWGGLEQRFLIQLHPAVRLTAGGEAQKNLRQQQSVTTEQDVLLSRNDKTYFMAGYVLADMTPARSVKITLGNRLDAYSTFGVANTPRGALIVHPYEAGTLKILGGKAFRAPSVFELYYNDGGLTQVSSPDLRPETGYSGEIEFSHRFSSTVTGLVTSYENYLTGLIVSRGEGTQASPIYLRNSESPVLTLGAEGEMRREWRDGWMMAASYSYQRSRYVQNTGQLRHVPNAPEHLASCKFAVPIVPRVVTFANRLSIDGGRYDSKDQPNDPAQGRTDGAAVWDAVLTAQTEAGVGLWTFALGVYNAFDRRYSVPLSREYRQASVVQNGRTILLSAAVQMTQ